MKAGPVLAMVGLIFVGMWMVLQPTLSRESYDFEVKVGAVELRGARAGGGWRFVEPGDLAELGVLSATEFMDRVDAEIAGWDARPKAEQTLLGFFNITGWVNFVWVAVGLGGQLAFFGRMMVQWVTSEKKRESVVPELFWWLSLIGGVALFTYFVWRKDFVGVLGQSTGVVVYARNLRLIKKQRRRAQREASRATAEPAEAGESIGADETGTDPGAAASKGEAHAGAAG